VVGVAAHADVELGAGLAAGGRELGAVADPALELGGGGHVAGLEVFPERVKAGPVGRGDVRGGERGGGRVDGRRFGASGAQRAAGNHLKCGTGRLSAAEYRSTSASHPKNLNAEGAEWRGDEHDGRRAESSHHPLLQESFSANLGGLRVQKSSTACDQ